MNLNDYYRKVYSQSGEDGILEALFDKLQITNGWCCEFGAGDGKDISNTLNLREKSWSSVLIEGNPKYYNNLESLRNEKTFPMISFISCEPGQTLDELLSRTPIPKDFDLMSMDIDGNDLYVWESLTNYTPKVVIAEYNGNFDPSQSLTIKYDSNHRFERDDYYGATAGALTKLATKKGYSLVGYTVNLNLIFCRNEYANNFLIHDHNTIPLGIRGWKRSRTRTMISY